MPDADPIAALEVPENVRRVLTDVLRKAREVFNADLLSVVLYGSAAAGQMRPTSDVNVLLVLKRLDFSAGERLSEALHLAEAAVGLRVMFLLETEVADAATAFALKFADITDRHVLLYGSDPFAALAVPRPAKIFRLKQVLLNLILRMREAFIRSVGEEKRRAVLIAEFAAPLRSGALVLLELENARPAASPKEALEQVAAGIDPAAFADALATLTAARGQRDLPAGAAGATMQRLIELGTKMHERASRLNEASLSEGMTPPR
jgi:predicted nucleotidyltransferase